MVKDYHIHPTVVLDPSRFAQFAKTAIDNGVDEVCITDHMPLSVSNAGDRIPTGRVGEYCTAVRQLANEWDGRLSVKLGIEIDYHPDYHDEIEAVLNSGDYDYVIGATHLHVSELNGLKNTILTTSSRRPSWKIPSPVRAPVTLIP